jgi:hypothetical protein
MQDVTDEAVRLIERNAPDFITAVQRLRGKRAKAARILLTLDAFADDPFLLYACLWYGATHGVTCTFVPLR